MAGTQTEDSSVLTARKAAAMFEAGLAPDQRKRLGQFFTGVKLARLLVAMGMSHDARTVLDPMAGTGDLLDAVLERSAISGWAIDRMDAVEIDAPTADVCSDRLSCWQKEHTGLISHVITGSAFSTDVIRQVKCGEYDLVITNPPYVRYQTLSSSSMRQATDQSPSVLRDALVDAVASFPIHAEKHIWRTLAEGYSGLSDLSVPSWLLAAMMVRPGGRLALVAPATWRNRDYATLLQYLLLRFFRVQAVVADQQPGWFSTALVRTQLVVATRLSTDDALIPIHDRGKDLGEFPWVEIAPSAASQGSLVGNAFSSTADAEGQFASWLYSEHRKRTKGITRRRRSFDDERSSVLFRCRSANWLSKVEPTSKHTSLFRTIEHATPVDVPHDVLATLDVRRSALTCLEDAGIRAGQGLRTGCNDFFYVDVIEEVEPGTTRVCLSRLFDSEHLDVPTSALRPVIRKQAELENFREHKPMTGRALVLTAYALPEDMHDVKQAMAVYERAAQAIPVEMPEPLASHVRRAARTKTPGAKGRLISSLSAVRTNIRAASDSRIPRPPRFWYMLPAFARRHQPDVFIPRVNQCTPSPCWSSDARLLVDANFSTLWSESPLWTGRRVAALLQSSWVQACLEAMGTPMGGGALKLEATHLRRIPVPVLSDQDIKSLATSTGKESTTSDETITKALMKEGATRASILAATQRLRDFISGAERARQRN